MLLNYVLLFLGSFTAQAYVVEIGNTVKIPHVREKIWIENPKTAQASSYGTGVIVKGLSIGRTKIRVDQKNHLLTVVPAGQIQAYLNWQKLSFQFADVSVGQCDDMVCLKGEVSTLKEFEKILALMNEQQNFVYLGLKISSQLQNQIEKWYGDFFRKNGLTPHKIVFGSPWKTFSPSSENKSHFEKVGLYHIEDRRKLEISDNLRVEIKVVEVKKELVRTLGIKWPDSYQASLLGIQNFDVFLNASERSGDMNILASPNLMCKSGKEASFFAGGEFPIKATAERYSSVTWKSYGIKLKIKPKIDSIGQINLEIESEISSLDKSHEVDGIPALHTHKVSSHFDLLHSQTIVLSGLIKNETGSASEGLPFLSQIPVLGRLFSSKNFLENKTELVIFVTPKLSE